MKLLSLVLILLLVNCKNVTKDLAILSYKINDSGDRVYYSITYEGFTNHLGESFSTEHIEDKVLITNFFFTRCPSICPPMRLQLIGIAEAFKKEKDFIIISHTIDPENDRIPVLKDYAEATGITNERWQFLRSDVDHTKSQAKQYMTHFRSKQDGTDFYHSSYVALVDKDQYIRGFYNILVPEEVKRLKEELRILLR